MPSNHLILCHPLLLPPSIFPSIRVFSNESALLIRPQYWSFNFSISPSSEYSELISFRIDWFDFFAVQETLKSLLQHHSSKASNTSALSTQPSLWSNSHICTWLLEKPQFWLYGHLLAKWCLVFNSLSRFVIAFHPGSKCLLISGAVTVCSDFGAQENKVCHCFHFFLHLSAMKWWDWIPWSLFFKCWVFSQLFHSPLLPSSRGSLVPLCFLPLGWCHLHTWVYWYFSLQSWFQFIIHPAWHFTYEITQPIKTNNPVPWGFLPPEMAHTLSMECVCPSINLFFHSGWFLKFFLWGTRGPHLATLSRDLPETWEVTILLHPIFFPAKVLLSCIPGSFLLSKSLTTYNQPRFNHYKRRQVDSSDEYFQCQVLDKLPFFL